MTFDEYKTVEHPVPYQYLIHKGDQTLYYFGANHSKNPVDKQYDMLNAFWKEFLARVDIKYSIVFVEGGKRPVNESLEDAIANGAEANYITYLASKAGVETFSPEPSEKERFEQLLQKFTKEEIAYYDFAVMMYQWNNYFGTRPEFYEYVNYSLATNRENSGWSDFDFTIDNMVRIQKKMFNQDFNADDGKFFYDVTNPASDLTRINELARYEDSGFRDLHILEQIEKYWNEGKSIFVVYGCSHAVMHEPAVRKLIS